MTQRHAGMPFYFHATNLLLHDIAFQREAISNIARGSKAIDEEKKKRIIYLNNELYTLNTQGVFDCLLIGYKKEKERTPRSFNPFMPRPKPLPQRVVLIDDVLNAMGENVPSENDEYEAFLEKYYKYVEKEAGDYIRKNDEEAISIKENRSALITQWLIFDSLNYGEYIKKSEPSKKKKKRIGMSHDKRLDEEREDVIKRGEKKPFITSEIGPEDIDEIVEDLLGGDNLPF